MTVKLSKVPGIVFKNCRKDNLKSLTRGVYSQEEERVDGVGEKDYCNMKCVQAEVFLCSRNAKHTLKKNLQWRKS